MGIPQNEWFIVKHPNLKWLIWRYPYFRKPPYIYTYIYIETRYIHDMNALISWLCRKGLRKKLRHCLVPRLHIIRSSGRAFGKKDGPAVTAVCDLGPRSFMKLQKIQDFFQDHRSNLEIYQYMCPILETNPCHDTPNPKKLMFV